MVRSGKDSASLLRSKRVESKLSLPFLSTPNLRLFLLPQKVEGLGHSDHRKTTIEGRSFFYGREKQPILKLFDFIVRDLEYSREIQHDINAALAERGDDRLRIVF